MPTLPMPHRTTEWDRVSLSSRRGMGTMKRESGLTVPSRRRLSSIRITTERARRWQGYCRSRPSRNDMKGRRSPASCHSEPAAQSTSRTRPACGRLRRERVAPPYYPSRIDAIPRRPRSLRSRELPQQLLLAVNRVELCCGAIHGLFSRAIALRIVRSLRMQATNATFFGLPRSTSL